MKKISVIIPNYNRAKIVTKAIDSVLNQSYPNVETIIVDDGSSDGSFEYLKNKYKQHENVIILKQNNNGVSSARNIGIKHAKGEWISFLDSDDFFS